MAAAKSRKGPGEPGVAAGPLSREVCEHDLQKLHVVPGRF
jgi:hypothetical protein